MPISATGNRARQRGISLIEILTVVIIIGLVGGMVVLTMPGEQSEARREAYRFAAHVRAASDLALTSGEATGLTAEAGTYNFAVYRAGRWQALPMPGMTGARHALGDAVSLELTPEGEPQNETAGGERGFVLEPLDAEQRPPMPPIMFSPVGETTAFTARFSGEDRSWNVVVGDNGGVRVEPTDD